MRLPLEVFFGDGSPLAGRIGLTTGSSAMFPIPFSWDPRRAAGITAAGHQACLLVPGEVDEEGPFSKSGVIAVALPLDRTS
jgi:hypothetical protein